MNKANSQNLEGIEKYLQENFKKPATSMISKILGEPSEYSHSIVNTKAHESQIDFKKFDLIWIAVNAPYLDKSYLPSSQSWGLFAIDNELCLHLCKSKPENLSTLLSIENNLETISAINLAKLFSDSCLSDKKNKHLVIEDFSDIQKFTAKTSAYIVSNIEIDIKPASITAIESDINLSFFTLKNWLNKDNQVNEMSVSIKKDFTYSICVVNVYEKIFSQIPNLRY